MATTLNPVRFGTEVIDQFGRYLMTTFPIADERMEGQVREALRHDVGGERLIAKGPYVHLNRPFEQGPSVEALVNEPALGLHPGLVTVFPYDSLHKHQELALRHVCDDQNVLVATGTGSGKTEAFLLPIIDHCLKLRDDNDPAGVAAILVYPMNALADDQLRRLRPLLAGTKITFGRYTGVTPSETADSINRLTTPRPYTEAEKRQLELGEDEAVPLPWEECPSRTDIRERKPRILLTNYSQLEYLLLRDRDLDLFRGAPLRFLVFDEVHTYTGALGSEVACLIRRLRRVARKTTAEVTCIGTSATVKDQDDELDAKAATLRFAHRLFGVPTDRLRLVTESYQEQLAPTEQVYGPPVPSGARSLLDRILEAVREVQLQDEVHELPREVLDLAEELCGRPAPSRETVSCAVFDLLNANEVVHLLNEALSEPALIRSCVERLREQGRTEVAEEDLVAEILAYLTLGALASSDGEPLLRPKLHYFVQGMRGLGVSYDEQAQPVVSFRPEAAEDEEGARVFPLVLCRSCGQHYVRLIAEPTKTHSLGSRNTGLTGTRAPEEREEPAEDETWVYVTDTLVGLSEGEEPPQNRYLCRFCGTLHRESFDHCLQPSCGQDGPLVPAHVHLGDMTRCLSCETSARGAGGIVTPVRSSEVADVTILAQSMLAAMPEEILQKLLVFTDNRQDAAFQAGWMDERSRRFRLRHLLYATLDSDSGRIWSLERLTERVVDQAVAEGVLREGTWDQENNLTRVRWFLLEEFASTVQRRNSLESLAMAQVAISGLDSTKTPQFLTKWGARLEVEPQALMDTIALILDYYRRRGVISDGLLKRMWTDRDHEVRKGLIQVPDHYRPTALALAGVKRNSFVKNWIATNGRSGAQEILRKSIPNGAKLRPEVRDKLLTDIWDWLISAGILVRTKLVQRRGGRIVPVDVPGTPYQIGGERLGILVSEERWFCPACRRSQRIAPPTGACTEYGCRGKLELCGRDPDHFDVVQYTRTRFVPLKTWEHTAQVPKERRIEIEREFKKSTGGKFNCLVCTPTLEMGVDIGKLEMVLMRNVPPQPSNYAQRAGRAGRRHRIAVVFTYCRGSSHDRYFFHDPRAIIAGAIRVPAFSMRNEPLIRKHVHSSILTTLRETTEEAEQEVLDRSLPNFIWSWFSRRIPHRSGRQRYKVRFLDKPPNMGPYASLVSSHATQLFEDLVGAFQQDWPSEDAGAVADDCLTSMRDQAGPSLGRQARRLYDQVQAWRAELGRLRRIEDEGLQLDEEEEAQRRRLRYALGALQSERRQANYTLSYLSVDGYFPGYAMTRESVQARCLEPFIDISRPVSVALRELTPANFIYADKNVFRVRKLNMTRLQGEDARETASALQAKLRYYADPEFLVPAERTGLEGGQDQAALEVTSFQLTDVELRLNRDIDDREEARRRAWFNIVGMLLNEHAGGDYAQVGSLTCRLLHKQHLRLVNLGLRVQGTPNFTLFPLCPVCGATRSPRASEAELERFRADHEKSCHQVPGEYALHADLYSDVLTIGPFQEAGDAVNLAESLRIGAGLLLDMGQTELECLRVVDSNRGHWAALYDPMPGGTGFLPLLVEYWKTVCERATEALQTCPNGCTKSCYACMRHFRNQQDHGVLDREKAVTLLQDLAVPLTMEHPIPAVTRQPSVNQGDTDSDAEVDFAAICAQRSFPVPPAAQFSVDLGGGLVTRADWAWPDRKVLVYIDGMSVELHGNPNTQQRDAVITAKLRMKGYNVVRITAEALQDDANIALHLEEIGVYLEG